MKKFFFWAVILVFFCAALASADTIILKDGTSYVGECDLQTVNFTDQQGVQYQFPIRDVQSLAFNEAKDTVALRDGKSYSGHFTGATPLSFQDSQGIRVSISDR